MNAWAVRYTAANRWSSSERIENDDTNDSPDFHIAMAPDGNGLAVFQTEAGAISNIWASRFLVNSGWAGPELIETDAQFGATQARVAIDGEGRALAVWQQQTSGLPEIAANRFE